MLRKLMKYELFATARTFFPFYGALLVISLINRLFISMEFAIPMGIASTIYGILVASICIMTLVLTIQRFRRNLLGNEGYLMLTLPVTADKLIVSKLLISSLWIVVSGLVMLISILILTFGQWSFGDIQQIFGQCVYAFLQETHGNQLQIILFLLEGVILIATGLFSSILVLYACISVSMLVNRHKTLFSFGAFIGFTMITQILVSILVRLNETFRWSELLDTMSTNVQAHLVLGILILWTVISGGLFYLISRYMITRKLNLE